MCVTPLMFFLCPSFDLISDVSGCITNVTPENRIGQSKGLSQSTVGYPRIWWWIIVYPLAMVNGHVASGLAEGLRSIRYNQTRNHTRRGYKLLTYWNKPCDVHGNYLRTINHEWSDIIALTMIDYYHGYLFSILMRKKSHVSYWNQLDNHNRQSYWPLSLITCIEPLFMAIINKNHCYIYCLWQFIYEPFLAMIAIIIHHHSNERTSSPWLS